MTKICNKILDLFTQIHACIAILWYRYYTIHISTEIKDKNTIVGSLINFPNFGKTIKPILILNSDYTNNILRKSNDFWISEAKSPNWKKKKIPHPISNTQTPKEQREREREESKEKSLRKRPEQIFQI